MKNIIHKLTLLVLMLLIGTVSAGCNSVQPVTDVPELIQTETAEPTAAPKEQELTDPTEQVEISQEDTPDEVPGHDDVYAGVDPTDQTVIFWHPFQGNQETALLDIIDDFNAVNQWGITLEAVYQGGYDDLQVKMLTYMNTLEAPNLLVADPTQAATYQLGDALVDMNYLVNHNVWGLTDSDKDAFFPGLFDQGVFHSFDGLRLSFPMYGTMNVLYYNADWLAEMGFNNPPENPEAFMEAACIAMGQPFSGSTATGRIGYQMNVHPSSFADWAHAFGSNFYDYGRDRYKYESSTAVAAMSFLQELLNRGCASDIPSPDGDQVDFGRGVLLFAIDSTEKISDFRSSVQAEANFNWRIAPLPHTTNSPATTVSGTSASIPKTTPKAQLAAWLFLRYFSNPETQAKWVQATNTLPVREDVAKHLGDYFTSSPASQMTIDLLMHSTYEPSVPGYTPVRDLSQSTLMNILAGADVAASLSKLSSDANLILEEQIALIPESPDPWVEVDPSGQTIIFWHQHKGARQAVLDEIINKFNATNKWGITVFPESKDGYGDIFLNLLPTLGNEEPPHLVMAYQHHAAAYQVAGGLADLTSLVESTKWGLTPQEVDDFFAGGFEQDIFPIFDSIRLGYPVQRSTDVLYYNAEWLAELGFDNPPATPKDFKRMACAASTPFSESSIENSLGYHFYLDSTRFSSWIFAFGGDVFDEDTNQFTYDTEVVKTTTKFFLDLIKSGCATPILDRIEAQTEFSEGTLLFMVDSSFHIPTVTELVDDSLEFDWSVAPIPSIGDEPAQNIFGASISMPASTPEVELAAWLFLKYFSNPEIQAKWGSGSNYLPVRSAAADHLADFFEGNPNYQIAFDLLPYGKTEPSLPGYDFVRQEVESALEAIFSEADLIATLDALNAIANQMLAVHLER
jgi:multiple sugar transport system substrate-binding protein/sn-glycerol 3-phosphate transport system substrate-binding protein